MQILTVWGTVWICLFSLPHSCVIYEMEYFIAVVWFEGGDF